MCSNHDKTIAKEATQEEFWKSIINKYEDRNANLECDLNQLRQRVNQMDASMPAVMTYNMAKLAKEGPSTDINNLVQSSCVCASCPNDEPQPAQPLKLPDMSKISVFSIESADICYMDKIKQLTEKEKSLINEVNTLKAKEKALKDVQAKVDKLSNSKGGEGVTVRSQDVGSMNESLVKENQRLYDELADCRLELKHLRENLEGPFQRELERERRKNSALEDDLRRKDKECEDKHCSTVRESALLKKQLEANEANLKDMRDINCKFREEITFLIKRNEQLQSDLINQKLSEATTLALMKTELEKKKKRRASSRSSFCTCKDSDSSGGDSKGGGRLVATQQPQQPTVTQVVSNATATLGEKTDQTEQTCPETCSKTTSNKSSLIQKSTPVQIESKETPQDIPVRGPQECPCKLPSDADLYKIARDLSQEIENAKGDKSVPDTLLETACDIKDLCDLIGKTCTNKICIEAGKSEVASVAKSTSKPSKKSKESVCICVLDGECATTTKVETPRSARTSIEKAASNRSPSKDSECVCGWAGECESKISDKSNTPPESGDQDDECICGAVGTCLDDDPGTSATPCKQHETSIDYTLQCDTICDNAVTDSNQISCVTKNTACAANIVQTHTDGVNVTTTFANPGLIEVVTENKDGTISTSMVINDAGNIEVITDVCKKNNCNQIDLVIEDYHSTGDGSSGGRSSHTENDSASKEVCREQCLECASPNLDDKLDTKRSSNEAAGDFVDVKRKSSKIDSYLLEMCPSAPLGFINDRCVTVAYVLNEGAGKTEGAEEQNEHEHQHDSPNIISPHASEYSHGDSDSMSEIIYVDDCGVGTSDGILDHVELSPLARFSSATCDKLAVIQEVDERHNTLQIGSRNKKQVDKIASNNTNDGNRVLHSDVSKPEVISLPMPMTCCPYHGLKLPIAQCLNEYNASKPVLVEVDNILLKPIEPDCIFDEYFFNKPVNTPKITKPAKDATTAMCPYHGHGGFVENKTEKSQNILGLLTNLATLPLAIPRPEPSVFPVISDQRYSKDQSMASSRPSREVRFDVIQQCSSSALSSNNFPVPQSLSCFSNISEYQTCVNPDAHTFAYSPNTYNAEACSCAYTGASPASSMQPSAWSITEDNKNVQPQSVNIQLRYDVLPEIREDRTQSIQSNTQVDESFMSAPKTGRYPNPSTNYPYIKYDTSVLNSRGIKRTSMDRTSHTRLVTPRTDPEGPPQPPKQVMLNSNANVRQSSFEATDNDFTSLDNTGRYATSSAFENLGDFPGGSKIVVVPQSVIQAGTINDFEQVTIPKDLTQHNPNVQTSNVSGQIRSCWNTKFTSQKAPFVPLDSKLAKYNKKINENTEFVPNACYCVKNQSAPISNVPENQMQQNVSLVNPIQQPQFASNLPNGPTFRECKESCKAVCSAKNLQPIDANSKPCLPTCGGPCSQQHIVYTGAGAQLPLQQNEMKMTPSRNVCVKACTAVCSNTNTVDSNMTVKSKPCVPSCSAICSKTSSVNRGMALSSSGVCAKTCIGVCSNTNTNMNTITNTLGTDRPFEPRPSLPSCSGVCSKSSTLNKVMDLTSSGICANTCTGICSNSNTRANVSAGTSRICQTSCTGVCATLGQDKTDEIFTKPGSPGSKGRICDRTCTAVCSNTNRYGTQRAPQSPNQSIDSGYIGICTKTCTGVCSKSNSYQRQDDMVMESQGTCSPDCTGVCAQSSTTNRRMDTDTSGVCERTCTGVCSKTNAYQGDVGMEQRICSPTSRRIDTKASGICDRTCTGACAINNAYQGDGMESSRTCSPDCTGPCAQSSPNRRIDLTSSNICAKTCTGSCSNANAYKNNMVSTSSNTCFQDCTGICAQSTGIKRNMDSSTTTVCAPTCTGVCSSNNGYQGDVVMESSRTCSPDCTGACAKSSTPNKEMESISSGTCARTCTGVCSSNNGYQGDVVMESSNTCSPGCTGVCALNNKTKNKDPCSSLNEKPVESSRKCSPNCTGECSKQNKSYGGLTCVESGINTSEGICANTCTGVCSEGNALKNDTSCSPTCTAVCNTQNKTKNNDCYSSNNMESTQSNVCVTTCTAVCSNANAVASSKTCSPECTGVCAQSYKTKTDKNCTDLGINATHTEVCECTTCTGICAKTKTTKCDIVSITTNPCSPTCTGDCSKQNQDISKKNCVEFGMNAPGNMSTNRMFDNTMSREICATTCSGICSKPNITKCASLPVKSGLADCGSFGAKKSKVIFKDSCTEVGIKAAGDTTTGNTAPSIRCSATCTGICSKTNIIQGDNLAVSTKTCSPECTGVCAKVNKVGTYDICSDSTDKVQTNICAAICTGVCSKSNITKKDMALEPVIGCLPECVGVCAKGSISTKNDCGESLKLTICAATCSGPCSKTRIQTEISTGQTCSSECQGVCAEQDKLNDCASIDTPKSTCGATCTGVCAQTNITTSNTALGTKEGCFPDCVGVCAKENKVSFKGDCGAKTVKPMDICAATCTGVCSKTSIKARDTAANDCFPDCVGTCAKKSKDNLKDDCSESKEAKTKNICATTCTGPCSTTNITKKYTTSVAADDCFPECTGVCAKGNKVDNKDKCPDPKEESTTVCSTSCTGICSKTNIKSVSTSDDKKDCFPECIGVCAKQSKSKTKDDCIDSNNKITEAKPSNTCAATCTGICSKTKIEKSDDDAKCFPECTGICNRGAPDKETKVQTSPKTQDSSCTKDCGAKTSVANDPIVVVPARNSVEENPRRSNGSSKQVDFCKSDDSIITDNDPPKKKPVANHSTSDSDSVSDKIPIIVASDPKKTGNIKQQMNPNENTEGVCKHTCSARCSRIKPEIKTYNVSASNKNPFKDGFGNELHNQACDPVWNTAATRTQTKHSGNAYKYTEETSLVELPAVKENVTTLKKLLNPNAPTIKTFMVHSATEDEAPVLCNKCCEPVWNQGNIRTQTDTEQDKNGEQDRKKLKCRGACTSSQNDTGDNVQQEVKVPVSDGSKNKPRTGGANATNMDKELLTSGDIEKIEAFIPGNIDQMGDKVQMDMKESYVSFESYNVSMGPDGVTHHLTTGTMEETELTITTAEDGNKFKTTKHAKQKIPSSYNDNFKSGNPPISINIQYPGADDRKTNCDCRDGSSKFQDRQKLTPTQASKGNKSDCGCADIFALLEKVKNEFRISQKLLREELLGTDIRKQGQLLAEQDAIKQSKECKARCAISNKQQRSSTEKSEKSQKQNCGCSNTKDCNCTNERGVQGKDYSQLSDDRLPPKSQNMSPPKNPKRLLEEAEDKRFSISKLYDQEFCSSCSSMPAQAANVVLTQYCDCGVCGKTTWMCETKKSVESGSEKKSKGDGDSAYSRSSFEHLGSCTCVDCLCKNTQKGGKGREIRVKDISKMRCTCRQRGICDKCKAIKAALRCKLHQNDNMPKRNSKEMKASGSKQPTENSLMFSNTTSKTPQNIDSFNQDPTQDRPGAQCIDQSLRINQVQQTISACSGVYEGLGTYPCGCGCDVLQVSQLLDTKAFLKDAACKETSCTGFQDRTTCPYVAERLKQQAKDAKQGKIAFDTDNGLTNAKTNTSVEKMAKGIETTEQPSSQDQGTLASQMKEISIGPSSNMYTTNGSRQMYKPDVDNICVQCCIGHAVSTKTSNVMPGYGSNYYDGLYGSAQKEVITADGRTITEPINGEIITQENVKIQCCSQCTCSNLREPHDVTADEREVIKYMKGVMNDAGSTDAPRLVSPGGTTYVFGIDGTLRREFETQSGHRILENISSDEQQRVIMSSAPSSIGTRNGTPAANACLQCCLTSMPSSKITSPGGSVYISGIDSSIQKELIAPDGRIILPPDDKFAHQPFTADEISFNSPKVPPHRVSTPGGASPEVLTASGHTFIESKSMNEQQRILTPEEPCYQCCGLPIPARKQLILNELTPEDACYQCCGLPIPIRHNGNNFMMQMSVTPLQTAEEKCILCCGRSWAPATMDFAYVPPTQYNKMPGNTYWDPVTGQLYPIGPTLPSQIPVNRSAYEKCLQVCAKRPENNLNIGLQTTKDKCYQYRGDIAEKAVGAHIEDEGRVGTMHVPMQTVIKPHAAIVFLKDESDQYVKDLLQETKAPIADIINEDGEAMFDLRNVTASKFPVADKIDQLANNQRSNIPYTMVDRDSGLVVLVTVHGNMQDINTMLDQQLLIPGSLGRICSGCQICGSTILMPSPENILEENQDGTLGRICSGCQICAPKESMTMLEKLLSSYDLANLPFEVIKNPPVDVIIIPEINRNETVKAVKVIKVLIRHAEDTGMNYMGLQLPSGLKCFKELEASPTNDKIASDVNFVIDSIDERDYPFVIVDLNDGTKVALVTHLPVLDVTTPSAIETPITTAEESRITTPEATSFVSEVTQKEVETPSDHTILAPVDEEKVMSPVASKVSSVVPSPIASPVETSSVSAVSEVPPKEIVTPSDHTILAPVEDVEKEKPMSLVASEASSAQPSVQIVIPTPSDHTIPVEEVEPEKIMSQAESKPSSEVPSRITPPEIVTPSDHIEAKEMSQVASVVPSSKPSTHISTPEGPSDHTLVVPVEEPMQETIISQAETAQPSDITTIPSRGPSHVSAAEGTLPKEIVTPSDHTQAKEMSPVASMAPSSKPSTQIASAGGQSYISGADGTIPKDMVTPSDHTQAKEMSQIASMAPSSKPSTHITTPEGPSYHTDPTGKLQKEIITRSGHSILVPVDDAERQKVMREASSHKGSEGAPGPYDMPAPSEQSGIRSEIPSSHKSRVTSPGGTTYVTTPGGSVLKEVATASGHTLLVPFDDEHKGKDLSEIPSREAEDTRSQTVTISGASNITSPSGTIRKEEVQSEETSPASKPIVTPSEPSQISVPAETPKKESVIVSEHTLEKPVEEPEEEVILSEAPSLKSESILEQVVTPSGTSNITTPGESIVEETVTVSDHTVVEPVDDVEKEEILSQVESPPAESEISQETVSKLATPAEIIMEEPLAPSEHTIGEPVEEAEEEPTLSEMPVECPPITTCKCDVCVGTEQTLADLEGLLMHVPFETIPVFLGEIILVPGEDTDEVHATIDKLKVLLEHAKDEDIPLRSIRTAQRERVFIPAGKSPSKTEISHLFNDNLKTVAIEDLPCDKVKTTDSIYAIFLPLNGNLLDDDIAEYLKMKLQEAFDNAMDSGIYDGLKAEMDKAEEQEDKKDVVSLEGSGDVPAVLKSACDNCCKCKLWPEHSKLLRAYTDFLLIEEALGGDGLLQEMDKNALARNMDNLDNFKKSVDFKPDEPLAYGAEEPCLQECNLEGIVDIIFRQTSYLPIDYTCRYKLEDKLLDTIVGKGEFTGDSDCHNKICKQMVAEMFASHAACNKCKLCEAANYVCPSGDEVEGPPKEEVEDTENKPSIDVTEPAESAETEEECVCEPCDVLTPPSGPKDASCQVCDPCQKEPEDQVSQQGTEDASNQVDEECICEPCEVLEPPQGPKDASCQACDPCLDAEVVCPDDTAKDTEVEEECICEPCEVLEPPQGPTDASCQACDPCLDAQVQCPDDTAKDPEVEEECICEPCETLEPISHEEPNLECDICHPCEVEPEVCHKAVSVDTAKLGEEECVCEPTEEVAKEEEECVCDPDVTKEKPAFAVCDVCEPCKLAHIVCTTDKSEAVCDVCDPCEVEPEMCHQHTSATVCTECTPCQVEPEICHREVACDICDPCEVAPEVCHQQTSVASCEICDPCKVPPEVCHQQTSAIVCEVCEPCKVALQDCPQQTSRIVCDVCKACQAEPEVCNQKTSVIICDVCKACQAEPQVIDQKTSVECDICEPCKILHQDIDQQTSTPICDVCKPCKLVNQQTSVKSCEICKPCKVAQQQTSVSCTVCKPCKSTVSQYEDALSSLPDEVIEKPKKEPARKSAELSKSKHKRTFKLCEKYKENSEQVIPDKKVSSKACACDFDKLLRNSEMANVPSTRARKDSTSSSSRRDKHEKDEKRDKHDKDEKHDKHDKNEKRDKQDKEEKHDKHDKEEKYDKHDKNEKHDKLVCDCGGKCKCINCLFKKSQPAVNKEGWVCDCDDICKCEQCAFIRPQDKKNMVCSCIGKCVCPKCEFKRNQQEEDYKSAKSSVTMEKPKGDKLSKHDDSKHKSRDSSSSHDRRKSHERDDKGSSKDYHRDSSSKRPSRSGSSERQNRKRDDDLPCNETNCPADKRKVVDDRSKHSEPAEASRRSSNIVDQSESRGPSDKGDDHSSEETTEPSHRTELTVESVKSAHVESVVESHHSKPSETTHQAEDHIEEAPAEVNFQNVPSQVSSHHSKADIPSPEPSFKSIENKSYHSEKPVTPQPEKEDKISEKSPSHHTPEKIPSGEPSRRSSHSRHTKRSEISHHSEKVEVVQQPVKEDEPSTKAPSYHSDEKIPSREPSRKSSHSPHTKLSEISHHSEKVEVVQQPIKEDEPRPKTPSYHSVEKIPSREPSRRSTHSRHSEKIEVVQQPSYHSVETTEIPQHVEEDIKVPSHHSVEKISLHEASSHSLETKQPSEMISHVSSKHSEGAISEKQPSVAPESIHADIQEELVSHKSSDHEEKPKTVCKDICAPCINQQVSSPKEEDTEQIEQVAEEPEAVLIQSEIDENAESMHTEEIERSENESIYSDEPEDAPTKEQSIIEVESEPEVETEQEAEPEDKPEPEPEVEPEPELESEVEPVVEPEPEPEQPETPPEPEPEELKDSRTCLDKCKAVCKPCPLGTGTKPAQDQESPSTNDDIKELQKIIPEIKCGCTKIEPVAGPVLQKKGSQFESTVSALQLALDTFAQKCQTKDLMIHALKKKLDDTVAPIDYKNKFQAQTSSPDYDRVTLQEALLKPLCLDGLEAFKKPPLCMCGTPGASKACDCQNDKTPVAVTDIRRIGVNSILVKWTCPIRGDLVGFEIFINGALKSRIFSPRRRTVVIDTIDLTIDLEIKLFAVGLSGTYPPAVAFYSL